MKTEFLRELAKAKSYRDFLNIVVEGAGGTAAFSRRAGFTSRSFLSEVLRGNRRLSHASYEKVVRAVKVPGPYKRLFKLLLAIEEPDVLSLQGTRDLNERIAELRKYLLNPAQQNDFKNVISAPNVPVVYAALGSSEKGASVQEICQRTKLGVKEIASVLEQLVKRNVITQKRDRYFTSCGDMDLEDLGGEEGFRQSYAQTADVLKNLALNAKPSNDNLFYYTAFPIDKRDLSKFKKELQEILLAHIERYQSETGDQVVRLNTGFFS